MLTIRAVLAMALVAALMTTTALQAQSLADVAKKAQEDRAKPKNAPAKVYTDGNLVAVPVPAETKAAAKDKTTTVPVLAGASPISTPLVDAACDKATNRWKMSVLAFSQAVDALKRANTVWLQLPTNPYAADDYSIAKKTAERRDIELRNNDAAMNNACLSSAR